MATFKKKFEITGHGIHSGAPVRMVIKPSESRGIVFHRVDLDNKKDIPAVYSNVGETKMRNTTVGKMDSAHVQTIEHCE